MVKTDLLFQKTFDSIKDMKNIKMKNLVKLITISAAVLAFCGCQTAPKEIPEDLSALQLIQRGQDEMSNGNYAAADAYYIACIDRYQDDLKTYVEARYELAQSNYKQKKYDMAKKMYTEIVNVFDDPNAIYQVQSKYKKLANMGLNRIKAIEDKQAKEEEKKAAKKAKHQNKK